MARVTLIEPAAASPDVQNIYEHRLRGRPANVHKAMAHLPNTLTPFLAFYASVGKTLERRLYELVYLKVSLLNGCTYCSQHHLKGAKSAEVKDEHIKALKKSEYSSFDPKEALALNYAEKLTLNPGKIAAQDIEALKEEFSETQVVDLHMLVGLANLTNRFTGPLGLDVEFPEEPI